MLKIQLISSLFSAFVFRFVLCYFGTGFTEFLG